MWAGISMKGPTPLAIFDGIMDRYMFVDILDKHLVPFVEAAYPNGHRLWMDNDPKHTSGKYLC